MTRQERYPETKTFHYHNANPKKRITGDCSARALSVACELDYKLTVMALAIVQIESGYGATTNEGEAIMLRKLGWKKMPQPKKPNGRKYTGREFCEQIVEPGKRYFVNIGCHHVAAVVDRKVWDIWDCTDDCVGNYWEKG